MKYTDSIQELRYVIKNILEQPQTFRKRSRADNLDDIVNTHCFVINNNRWGFHQISKLIISKSHQTFAF